MGLFTTIAGAATSFIGVVGSAYQMRQGRKMMDQAMDAMRDMPSQALENAFKNIEISTMAQDMQRTELARSEATYVDAASKAGARGVVGAMGDIMEFKSKGIQNIAAQLEEKRTRRDEMIAADEVRIREMRERREEMEINALSNLYATGSAERMTGLGGLAKSISGFTSGLPGLFGDTGGKVDPELGKDPLVLG